MRPISVCRCALLVVCVETVVPAAATDTGAAAARGPQPVVRVPFSSSLAPEGLDIRYRRAGSATYFDTRSNRIVTVSAHTPRFVATEARCWGASTGLLLERGSGNLMLDSSFEADLAPWTFGGKVEKRAGGGVHGKHGLVVTGPATLTHRAISLKTPPDRHDYVVSVYVRRRDGAAVQANDVRCFLESDRGLIRPRKPSAPERLGNGPWYRCCARIQTSGVGDTPHTVVFRFGKGQYQADAAQLEYTWQGPSSYIPTQDRPARRSHESVHCLAKALFPGSSWAYAFWTYAYPNTGNNEPIVTIRDRGDRCVVHSNRYWTIAGDKRARPAEAISRGWLFITVTYDGKRMDVFHNGVSDHTLGGPFEVAIAHARMHKVVWAQGNATAMGLVADFTTWGRALAPDEVRALYRTGTPKVIAASANAQTAIPVRFRTQQAGRVSVNIFDSARRLVHQLAVGKKLPAGTHTLAWDGCDDEGRPVPKGDYTFKGLVSNVRSVWDGKVANTSPSPGYEHLQYRTGHYSDVIALPDGGLVTCTFWGEHSRIIQRIDGTPGYPVRWSSSYNSPWPALCVAGAVDGQHLYTVFSRMIGKGRKQERQYYEVLVKWSLKDGLRVPGFEVKLTEPHAPTGPIHSLPGCREDPANPIPFAGVCGLAYHAGKLYVPFRLENRVGVYDVQTMKEVSRSECPSPRRIAVGKRGEVLVTSDHEVFRFEPGGTGRSVLAKGLSSPWGIAIGPKGVVYVTDAGDSHQMKVFAADGKPRRTYGQKGGHRGGRVHADLLDMPLAVALNGQGHIFVADFGGQRVVALNRDFSLRKIIHGRMPYTMWVSNLDRSRVYSSFHTEWKLWEYKVDYSTGTSSLWRRWDFERCGTGKLPIARAELHFRRWKGRLFGIWPAHGVVVEMIGDRMVQRVHLGREPRRRGRPGRAFVWRDRNGDGRKQDGEYEYGDAPKAMTYRGGYVDPQGNLYTHARGPFGIIRIPFEGLDDGGLPIYRWTSAQWVLKLTDRDTDRGLDGKPYRVEPSTYMQDRSGHFYVSDCAAIDFWKYPKKNISIRKHRPDGTLVWKVGGRRRGAVWKPGQMAICCSASGIVDDRYLFYIDYTGPINCWDTDGLWVGRLLADLPEELRNEGEAFDGLVFRHPNGKVYAYSSPDCTYRISRIVVEGLEKIERFAGRVAVASVAPPRRIQEQRLAPWRVLKTRGPVAVDGTIGVYEWGTNTDTQAPITFEREGRPVAKSWAQWDDQALYLAWRIRDKSPAVNKSRGRTRWAGDQATFMIRAQKGVTTTSASGRHTATEYQLEIGTDGDGRLGAYVILNGSDKKGKFLPGAKVALKVMDDKSGYTMEAALPWASLGDYRPHKGDRILWNMRVHWGTPDGGAVAHFVQWAPGHHVNPQSWGTAVFE